MKMYRVCFPDGIRAVIKKDSYPIPPIFTMLAREGQIEEHMMYNTYNMGLGMVIGVKPEDADTVIKAIESAGEKAYVVGKLRQEKRSYFMLNIGVLVSGGGTNLQAIIDGIENGSIPDTEIRFVISNNKNAYALERAKKHQIPAEAISPKDFETREAFNQALVERIDSYGVDLVVLAGCLLIIPPQLIEKYRYRIINIHPSLIPSFCGKGYYGLHVHEKVLERG